MKKHNIVILGAGIGGLCSAIALGRKGFKVSLYERSTQPQNIGAGLVLWPNATHILELLDLHDDIKSMGYTLEKMQRFTDTGEFLNEIDLNIFSSKTNNTNYAITRNSLQNILISKLEQYNIKIHFDNCVTSIKSQTNNTAVVHFENGKKIDADIIIGADGRMNSITRKYVNGNNKPIYQSYVNWVGITNTKTDLDFKKNILDYWGCGERFGIVPLSRHCAYWAGCKVIPKGLGEPDIGNKNTLLTIFRHWPDDIKSIIELSPEKQIKRIEVYDHNPIPKWHRDNVCLIGDAAHAALPTSGQGACQAIEDAYYLAECLTNNQAKYRNPENLLTISNIQYAFEQFYKLRSESTDTITHNARFLTRSIFNTDPEFCKTRNQKAREQ
ncbi:MAG: FAD-dependent monooxygenase [Thiohalomonadales bacterium]